jgi:hypothetical protein
MAASSSPVAGWLQEPRNRLIAIIGALVLIVAAVAGILFATGVFGGSSAETGTTTVTGNPTPGAAAPGAATPAAGTPGSGGQPISPDTAASGASPAAQAGGGGDTTAGAGPGGGGPADAGGAGRRGARGGGGAAGGTTAGGGPGEPVRMASGGIPHRSDPFQYNPELRKLYAEMRPLPDDPGIIPPDHRDQWYELYKPPKGRGEDELADVEPELPVPPMRVAGISHGSSLAAMLQIGDERNIIVVRPGQTLKNSSPGPQATDFHVDSVERDRVFLSRKVTGYKKRQHVEVTMEPFPGAPAGGAPAMGGGPPFGSGPGSGGFPGARPGGSSGGRRGNAGIE